MYNNKGEDKL